MEGPGDFQKSIAAARRGKDEKLDAGSLTCSGKGSAQSMISWGLSTGIRDAYPRAESNFNSRTLHETGCKATITC